jgi:hypothetical protein
VVNAWRYGLQARRHERAEVSARKVQELGGGVRLTHVPTEGERAQRAGEVLRASKAPPGVEPHCAFLQDPLLVQRLCLKKPERRAALGLV